MAAYEIVFTEDQNVVEIIYEGVNAQALAALEVRVTNLEDQFVDNNGNIIDRLDQLDEDVASQATLNAVQTAAITQEISLRIAADFDITTQTAEDINALALSTGAAIALEANTRAQAILDEATARGAAIASSEAIIYGDMAILATSVEGMATELGAAQASIIVVSDALSTETAARVAQYTALQADYGTTNAAVLEESVARADADTALASSITALTAIATSKNKTFRQTSAPTAEGVGDLWYDTDDNNKLYRWDGSLWVNIQDGNIPINAAAIVTESAARATADSALASSITVVSAVAASKNATFRQASAPTALGTGDLWYDSDDGDKLYRWNGSSWVATDDARIAANAVSITAETSARATADGIIEGKYGVKIDVNGHVSGFGLISTANNAAPTSTFTVTATSFQVYNGTSPISPFQVTGGEVILQNLIVKSTIRQGQTAYDTGTGFWLGDAAGTPKFSLGNSAGNKITWDGSELSIAGSLDISNTEQAFTPTWTGFSSAPSGDISYIDLGSVVIMWVGNSLSGTSNTTAMTITNLPSAIQPGTTRVIQCLLVDNASLLYGSVAVVGATMTFALAGVIGSRVGPTTSGFTGSSSKGLGAGWLIVYTK